MTENAYRPGAWFALIGPSVAVLVDDRVPQAQLDSLWQAVSSDAEIEALLATVASGQAAGPQAFGVVTRDADTIKLMVRAGVTATVVDAGGASRSIDSGGVSTRVEYLADSVSMITLGRAGAASGAPSLPISTGVVAADSLDWCAQDIPARSNGAAPAAAHQPESEPMIEAVPDPVPAEVGAPGGESNGAAAGGQSAANAPTSAMVFDDEELEGGGDDSPGGDHDGHTVARPLADAAPPPAAGGPPTPSAPVVQAVSCPDGHANPPLAQLCRICDKPLGEQEPVSVPRPSLGSLRFSTGQLIDLNRRVVIGRSPSVERVSGDDLPNLVQVESPEHDISRSHVEVRLEGWHVLAVDLESVNGTVVTLPGRSPERLHPREAYPLVPGAVVDLAGEVTFRYEAPS